MIIRKPKLADLVKQKASSSAGHPNKDRLGKWKIIEMNGDLVALHTVTLKKVVLAELDKEG